MIGNLVGNMHKGFNPNDENKRKSEQNSKTKEFLENAEQEKTTMKQRRKEKTKEKEMEVKLLQENIEKLRTENMEINQSDK